MNDLAGNDVQKWKRRAFASMAAAIAAILLGLAGMAWQAKEASHQRDAARESERQQALLRQKTEEIAMSEIALRAAAEASEKRSIADKEEAHRQRDEAERAAAAFEAKYKRELEQCAAKIEAARRGAGK